MKLINPFKPHVVELPDGGFAIRLYRLFSAQFLTEFGTYTDCVDNLMLLGEMVAVVVGCIRLGVR